MQQNRFFVCAPEYEVYSNGKRISYNRPVNLSLTRTIVVDTTKDKDDKEVTYYAIVFDGNAHRWLFTSEEERNDVLDTIMDKVEV